MINDREVLCTPCSTAQVAGRQQREAETLLMPTYHNPAAVRNHKELIELFARFLEDQNKQ